MANYNITASSTFTPYDFSGMLSPILDRYDEKYTTAYDQYKKEKQEAAALEYIIQSINEAEISDAYNNYMDRLNTFGDTFLNGYNQQTQQDSLALREQYFKEINPILEQYDKKQELIKEQIDFLRQNPTAIYDRDFRTTSISDMLKNPQMTYNTIKGDDIKKDAYNFIDAVSKAVYNSNYEGLDDQSKQFIKYWESEGYSPDTLMRYIVNPQSAPAHIREGIKSIKEKYVGMGEFTKDQQEVMDNYIQEGALLAAGSYKYQWLNNPNYDKNPERTKQLEEWEYQKAQHELEEQQHKTSKAKYDALMSEGKYTSGSYLKDGRKSTGKADKEEEDKLEFKKISGIGESEYYEATSKRFNQPIVAHTEDQKQILNDIFYNSNPDIKKMAEQGEDVVLESVGCILDDEWFNDGQEETTKKSHLSEGSDNVNMFSEYTTSNLIPLKDSNVEDNIISRLVERIYAGTDVNTLPGLSVKESKFQNNYYEFNFIYDYQNKIFTSTSGKKDLIKYLTEKGANETQIGNLINMAIEGIIKNNIQGVINKLKQGDQGEAQTLDYARIQNCITQMSTDYNNYIKSAANENSRKDYITGFIRNMKDQNKLVFGQLDPRKESKRESDADKDYVIYKVKDIEDIKFKK